MITDRSQIGISRSTWSQLRMLADRAGLSGAEDLIQGLDRTLTDQYIHRKLRQSHPREPRSTAESIARGVWRRAFLRDNFDFWNASNETDALDAFYHELTLIADEVSRDYRNDNFKKFQKRHARLVNRILTMIPKGLREDAQQECWMRITKEIPLHDIMEGSREQFIPVIVRDVAIVHIRQLERLHERTVDRFPDPEDTHGHSSWRDWEEIAAAYKNPALALKFFRYHLSGMTRGEIVRELGWTETHVKKIWAAILRAVRERHPERVVPKKDLNRRFDRARDAQDEAVA